MARLEGLEPPTYRFEVCRSIQLSYRRENSTVSATNRFLQPSMGAAPYCHRLRLRGHSQRARFETRRIGLDNNFTCLTGALDINGSDSGDGINFRCAAEQASGACYRKRNPVLRCWNNGFGGVNHVSFDKNHVGSIGSKRLLVGL